MLVLALLAHGTQVPPTVVAHAPSYGTAYGGGHGALGAADVREHTVPRDSGREGVLRAVYICVRSTVVYIEGLRATQASG